MSTAVHTSYSRYSNVTALRPNPAQPSVGERRPAPTRLRLTRRGRVVLSALLAVPLAAGIMALALNGGGAEAGQHSGASSLHYLTVASGQSLWSIAQKVDPSADPRDVVAAIEQLNGIGAAGLQAGQQLAIPAQYDSAQQ